MVVYSRRARSNRCEIYEQIYPEFINEPIAGYILKDYDKSEIYSIFYSQFLNFLLM
jgi:hypothetical protein